MDTPGVIRPPVTLRWVLAVASLSVCAATVLVVSRNPSNAEALKTMSLLAIALAISAWATYEAIGALAMSLLILLCLLWAWAAHRTPTVGIVEVPLCAAVIATVAWRRRMWTQRLRHLHQVLEDLAGERTVKEQALASAQLAHAALQKKYARYTQLQAIAEQLSNMTDLRSIAQLAVERAFILIGKSDVCLLFLVDAAQHELSLYASRKREGVVTVRTKHGDQFDRYVLRTQRPLLVNDVRRDFRFTVSLASERPISSVVACPLLLDQGAKGVLRLDSAAPGAYSQDDLRFLDILLDLVATALTNARLFAQTQQLAMTDGLTGLTLRRPLLDHLTRELARASRSREAVSVLLLDIDRFKAYNDAFGHTAGDLILKSVAEVLRAAVPPDGISARYGGEEFAVLLPRTLQSQAGQVAERIRRSVESGLKDTAWGGGPVTVSIGLASFPDDAQAELELLRIADQRLYHAKRAGRNLVCSGEKS